MKAAGDTAKTLPLPSHRYSSLDEMRYIRYGIGDHEFSPLNQQLLDYIRSQTSQQSPTRPRNLPENLTDGSEFGQAEFVDKHLSGRRNGFYIDCGANDGIDRSNTLFFELKRDWTGLLIEANPAYYRKLMDINRRAYVLGACLSPKRRPISVSFLQRDVTGGIVDYFYKPSAARGKSKSKVDVNCFPLNSIATALNISHVDYFSLDVEGPEIEILQTIDWSLLRIDVITVEYRVYGGPKEATLKKLEKLRKFFNHTGVYRELGILPNVSEDKGLDVVFSHV